MLHLYNTNPHYLAQDGRPILLVGSGEHYGALLNRAFDYATYFETLHTDGLNQVRVFSGTYREVPGSFAIEDNTLAPKSADFLCPYTVTEAGKFDLSQWNEAYFTRLHELLTSARDNGVVVEFVLFCFWYEGKLWQQSPLHPANTVQAIGPDDKEQVFTVDNALLPYLEALVRKIVTEINEFDNVYLEICNEPYSRHDHTDYRDFQAHIAEIIADTEATLPNRHLIALNVQNRAQQVVSLPEQVSIINFHYALPDAVHLNYHLGKVIADDETGFAGQKGTSYRREAWQFFLSGGGIFSHLDYSFTVAHPDGTAPIHGKTPGFGGPLLRKQFAQCKRFLEEAAVWNLAPLPEISRGMRAMSSHRQWGFAANGTRFIWPTRAQWANSRSVCLPGNTNCAGLTRWAAMNSPPVT